MKFTKLENITDWTILITALLMAIIGVVFGTIEMFTESGITYGVAVLLIILREVIKIRIILESLHNYAKEKEVKR